MTDSLKLTVDAERQGLAVIYTDGYINNQGGEEIARVAYELIDRGNKNLLLKDAKHMGIALVHDGKTEFKTFWTLVLGAKG